MNNHLAQNRHHKTEESQIRTIMDELRDTHHPKSSAVLARALARSQDVKTILRRQRRVQNQTRTQATEQKESNFSNLASPVQTSRESPRTSVGDFSFQRQNHRRYDDAKGIAREDFTKGWGKSREGQHKYLALVFHRAGKGGLVPQEFVEDFRKYNRNYIDLKLFRKHGNGIKFESEFEEDHFKLCSDAAIWSFRKANLEVEDYISVGGDKRYVLVGASEERLLTEAARIGLRFPLDGEEVFDAVLDMGLPLAKNLGYRRAQVGFYFAFLRFYTIGLVPLSVCGVAAYIQQVVAETFDVEMSFIIAFMVCIWGPCFIEMWKRESARYSMKWGMLNFKAEEETRFQFHGEKTYSRVDGQIVRQAPVFQTILRRIVSMSAVAFLMVLSIMVLITLYTYRQILSLRDVFGSAVFTTIYGLIVAMMNLLYGVLAWYLNEIDNYHTDSQFEEGLVAKIFCLKFVNSYSVLFYYAFLKQYDTVYPCNNDLSLPQSLIDDSTCLAELRYQLLTLSISQVIMGNFFEYGFPYLVKKSGRIFLYVKKLCLFLCGKSSRNEVVPDSTQWRRRSKVEKQYSMNTYNSPLSDFDELILQYGYLTMFIVVFPLGPLLAIVNNLVEKQLDLSKLFYSMKRPVPHGATGIGYWKLALSTIALISVVSNLLLLTVNRVPTAFWNSVAASSPLIFIILEHVIISVMAIVNKLIPDVPREVKEHTARQDYLDRTLIGALGPPQSNFKQ
eukprot:jgi/Bigna1/130344/aug1.11_g5052